MNSRNSYTVDTEHTVTRLKRHQSNQTSAREVPPRSGCTAVLLLLLLLLLEPRRHVFCEGAGDTGCVTGAAEGPLAGSEPSRRADARSRSYVATASGSISARSGGVERRSRTPAVALDRLQAPGEWVHGCNVT